MKSELFDVIDDATGKVIGQASRRECHGNPALLHRTAHIFVFHPDGRILLQKRREDKDIQPGKWDASVGGHLDSGEEWEEAARRELREELGFAEADRAELTVLFDLKIRNSIESENTRVYSLISAGPFTFQESEIAGIRFWTEEELRKELSSGAENFTPVLTRELQKILKLKEVK